MWAAAKFSSRILSEIISEKSDCLWSQHTALLWMTWKWDYEPREFQIFLSFKIHKREAQETTGGAARQRIKKILFDGLKEARKMKNVLANVMLSNVLWHYPWEISKDVGISLAHGWRMKENEPSTITVTLQSRIVFQYMLTRRTIPSNINIMSWAHGEG